MADLDLSGFDKAVAAAPKQEKQLDLSHFDNAVANASNEPSALDAGIRGGFNGIIPGAEPAIAGALQAAGDALDGNTNGGLDGLIAKYKQYRDLENSKNKAAEDAHPIAYNVGNIAGGIPLAAFTGGAGEIPEAANMLTKVMPALKAGATIGGVSGLGSSLSNGDNLSDTVKNTISGAGMGAGTGALLHGLVGTGKFVGGKLADTDTWNNFANAAKHTMDGVKLTGKSAGEGVKNLVGDAAESIGLGLRDENKTQGALLGKIRDAASKNGSTVNTQKYVDGIKNAIDKLNNSSDPDAADDAKFLQRYLDNLVLGKETPVQLNEVIPEKTIPGTPSAEDKILAAKAQLEAKENALPKGAQTSIVPSEDNEGNPFLNILKQTPGEEEGYPNQAIGKTLPNTPGTPDQVIPGGLGPDFTQTVRMGGINPEATPFDTANEIKKTLTRFAGNGATNSPLKTDEAINAISGLAKGVNQDIIHAPAGGIGPATELGQATKNSQLSFRALKELGLDDTDFEKNPITGEMELTSDAERSLKNKVRQLGNGNDTSSGQNASDALNSSMDYLKEINPDKAAQLQGQVSKAAEINNLYRMGQGANFTKSSLLRTAPVQAGAFVGSAMKNLGVPEALNAAKGVVSSVAQGVSKTQMAQTARSLLATGSPNQMKLAQQLGEAMNNTTDTARNAAVFSLMQQPGYRELLKQHGLGNDDNQQ